MNLPQSHISRNTFFEPLSTAYQLAGFLKGLKDGVEHWTASDITDDMIDQMRIALGEAQAKAEFVASFVSEVIDGEGGDRG